LVTHWYILIYIHIHIYTYIDMCEHMHIVFSSSYLSL
jgi:hypothetical protein